MPELPEVERARRIAEGVALGRRITSLRCARDNRVFSEHSTRSFRHALLGATVVAVNRWGKQLWFELDRTPHPLFHFGMTGAFQARGVTPLQLKAGPVEEPSRWPPRFTKFRLGFEDDGELVLADARRFARVLLRDSPCSETPLCRLGFDPLYDLPAPAVFTAGIRARRATLKSVLLDQTFVAGIGNWLADEIAFQSRIDPRRPACNLTVAECQRIRTTLKHVVETAVLHNADDTQYPIAWLFHHRWGRNHGARTSKGDLIEFTAVAGRTTAWVPNRQR